MFLDFQGLKVEDYLRFFLFPRQSTLLTRQMPRQEWSPIFSGVDWSCSDRSVKYSSWHSGDQDGGLILGLGTFPGVGNGNLLQYSCLENSMDRGAQRATIHGIIKSWTWLSTLMVPQCLLEATGESSNYREICNLVSFFLFSCSICSVNCLIQFTHFPISVLKFYDAKIVASSNIAGARRVLSSTK